METRHPVDGSLGSEFPSIYNQCGVYGRLKSQDVKIFEKFLRFFATTTPYGNFFSKFSSESFQRLADDVLCSNFVKFGRREIGEIVRCLPDKNKISPGSAVVANARIAPKICLDQPTMCSTSGCSR